MTTTPVSARAVKVPKAAEMIAAELRSEIVSGAVADGQRLGSEQDMLERFGVSRPTLREAIRILETESMIEIVRGAHGGVVARRPDEGHTLRAMAVVLESRGVTLSDVYEARTVIEPPAARRVAETRGRRATARQLRRLVDLQEESIEDPTAFAAANVEFHEKLVEASGNQTLVLLADVLHDLIAGAVTRLTEEAADDTALVSAKRGVAAQRKLLELIEAGDGAGAEKYWRSHMESVGAIMLRNGGDRTVVSHTDLAAH